MFRLALFAFLATLTSCFAAGSDPALALQESPADYAVQQDSGPEQAAVEVKWCAEHKNFYYVVAEARWLSMGGNPCADGIEYDAHSRTFSVPTEMYRRMENRETMVASCSM